MKALASTEAKRAGVAPDLPTIAESALPGYNTGVWFGLLAPAGTPPAVIDKVSKASNDTLRDAEVVDSSAFRGWKRAAAAPKNFATSSKSETERWGASDQVDGARRQDQQVTA